MERETLSLTKQETLLFSIISTCASNTPNKKPSDSVYIFGGWVRDKLLGRTSKDYDLCISKALFKPFLKNIKNTGFRVSIKETKLDEYPKIGQLLYSVTIKDLKLKFSLTILEIDIEKELAAKDFTINSLCYDILKRGLVRNRTTIQGRADLESRILRTNASVELTLKQAPSRIIRMIRFALEYEFKLSNDIISYFESGQKRQVARYYSNSFFNQLRKLVRYIDTEQKKVKEFLGLLDKLKILELITLWFDYRAKRIVVFFVKLEVKELKEMIKKEQIIAGEHFVSVRLGVRELVKHQQYCIRMKNGKGQCLKGY